MVICLIGYRKLTYTPSLSIEFRQQELNKYDWLTNDLLTLVDCETRGTAALAPCLCDRVKRQHFPLPLINSATSAFHGKRVEARK